MKRIIALIMMLFVNFSFAQMRPIGKVYIVEGVVVDGETFLAIPSAILYNDSLHITTTSDENGYFKIVIPYDLIKDKGVIPIEIEKTSYKRIRSGFRYNGSQFDSSQLKQDKTELYSYDIKLFFLAPNRSGFVSTGGSIAPVVEGAHGAIMVKKSYGEWITREQRERKFTQLKQGNETVYFQLDSATGLATRLYDIIVIGALKYVYIDGKKVSLTDINKLAKRNNVFYDKLNSNELTKINGREVIALRTTPPPGLSEERLNASIKATLEIEIDK